MLSHIVRLVCQFEREHGLAPNVLGLGPDHLQRLCDAFDPRLDVGAIARLLRMELLLDREALHPRVARVQGAARRRAG